MAGLDAGEMRVDGGGLRRKKWLHAVPEPKKTFAANECEKLFNNFSYPLKARHSSFPAEALM